MSQLWLHAVDSLLFARIANAKKAGAGQTEELLKEAVQGSCSIELVKGAVLGSCSNMINGGAQGSVCAQENWSAQCGCSGKPLRGAGRGSCSRDLFKVAAQRQIALFCNVV